MALNADKIRESFLQKRADFHSYHSNTASSTIIKRIIQAEKVKKIQYYKDENKI